MPPLTKRSTKPNRSPPTQRYSNRPGRTLLRSRTVTNRPGTTLLRSRTVTYDLAASWRRAEQYQLPDLFQSESDDCQLLLDELKRIKAAEKRAIAACHAQIHQHAMMKLKRFVRHWRKSRWKENSCLWTWLSYCWIFLFTSRNI